MKEIILNERAYAEKLIEEYSLGKDEYVSINILAKYWRSEGLYAPQIRRKIEEHILRSKPYAQMFRYTEMIHGAVEKSKKWPLREIDAINIMQSELERIASLDGTQEQQLLFAMLCLAKYRLAANPKSDGWINTPRVDVYRMANVFGTLEHKAEVQRHIHDADMIEWPRRADSENVRVLICESVGEPVLQVRDFRNLGYQYRQWAGDPYFACSECGLVVRRNSNRMKYCKDCADEINRQKARERWFQLA